VAKIAENCASLITNVTKISLFYTTLSLALSITWWSGEQVRVKFNVLHKSGRPTAIYIVLCELRLPNHDNLLVSMQVFWSLTKSFFEVQIVDSADCFSKNPKTHLFNVAFNPWYFACFVFMVVLAVRHPCCVFFT